MDALQRSCRCQQKLPYPSVSNNTNNWGSVAALTVSDSALFFPLALLPSPQEIERQLYRQLCYNHRIISHLAMCRLNSE